MPCSARWNALIPAPSYTAQRHDFKRVGAAPCAPTPLSDQVPEFAPSPLPSPPQVGALEALRQADPSSAQLLALEACVAQALRLLPVAASAAEHFGHDLPLEEFLFHVSLHPVCLIVQRHAGAWHVVVSGA